MRRRALFVVGGSGAGKSTLTRGLLGAPLHERGHWTIGEAAAAPGRYHGGKHDGPDKLPSSRPVLWGLLHAWEATVPAGHLAVFDGFRFGAWCIDWVQAMAECRCVLLVAPHDTMLERRAARGSTVKSEAWLAGRTTQARRFAERFKDSAAVDASLPAADVLAAVRAML